MLLLLWCPQFSVFGPWSSSITFSKTSSFVCTFKFIFQSFIFYFSLNHHEFWHFCHCSSWCRIEGRMPAQHLSMEWKDCKSIWNYMCTANCTADCFPFFSNDLSIAQNLMWLWIAIRSPYHITLYITCTVILLTYFEILIIISSFVISISVCSQWW